MFHFSSYFKISYISKALVWSKGLMFKINMCESFQDHSRVQDFEADFPYKVVLPKKVIILNKKS